MMMKTTVQERAARAAVVIAGLLAVVPASGQVLGPDLSSAELKCQTGIAGAEAKLLAARLKCVTKCLQGVRKGDNPASDCQEPAFGGDTATCVADPAKGAQAKAVAAIGKACTTDCPDCFAGSDCGARAMQAVAEVATIADVQLTPFIYCGDQGSLKPGEAKCEDTAAKTATKLAQSLAKCTAKCKAAEGAGKIAPGTCAPSVDDPPTAQCIQKAQDKAVATINKSCTVERPSCYSGFPGPLFAGLTTSVVDGRYAKTYCGF